MNSSLDNFNNFDEIKSFDLKPIKNLTAQKIISVDVWTGDLDLQEFFDENVNCLTIHPTGFYLTLSFSNRIDFFSILHNQLICNKSFKCASKNIFLLLISLI